MANVQLLQTVNVIAGDLDRSERRSMLYLCGHPVSDSKGECLPEFLKSGIIRGQMNDQFLAELLFVVKRFDILRKVFGTRRQEIESALENRHMLSKYRVLMVNINEDITNGDIKNLLFLLSRTVPREKMDNLKYFLDVVIELEKMDKLSPERLDFMEKCLRHIDRVDLAKKLCSYKQSDEADRSRHSVARLEDQQHCTTTHSPTQSEPYPLQRLNHQQPLNEVPQMSPVPVSRRPSSPESLMEEYGLQAQPRGLCLIIDCVGTDGDRVEHAFRALHFKVELHKLLSLDDTVSLLTEVASGRRAEHRSADAFVCCLISRGTDHRLLATDAPGGGGLELDAVRQLFGGSVCPMLAGKPKLFFIQRYGVSAPPPSPGPEPETPGPPVLPHVGDSRVEPDGGGGQAVPTDADVLWSHCWTDEHQLQQRNHCSVYLTALSAGLLKGQKRKTSLVDVHTELNRMVYDHNKRNPVARYDIELKHTLRRRLFLT